MAGRRKAREQAFLLMFETNFNSDPIEQIIEYAQAYREEEFDSYATQTATDSLEKVGELDAIISARSQKWSKERLSKVALTVLRLALFEMHYVESVPVSVSINEAVELSKKYGGEDDSAFVNGLLGAVARDMEKSADGGIGTGIGADNG